MRTCSFFFKLGYIDDKAAYQIFFLKNNKTLHCRTGKQQNTTLSDRKTAEGKQSKFKMQEKKSTNPFPIEYYFTTYILILDKMPTNLWNQNMQGPIVFFFQVILVLHYNIQQSAVNYTYHFKHNSDHNNFLGYLSFLCGTSLSRQLIQTHFFQFQFQLLIKFLTNRVFLSIPNTFLLDFDQSYKT